MTSIYIFKLNLHKFIFICFRSLDLAKARFASSPEDKLKFADTFIHTKAPNFCKIVLNFLEKNGGTYLVGDSVIWV